MAQPTFNPQTNLWYRGDEVLIPQGNNDAAVPDYLYSPSQLAFFGVDGARINPFTFHAATDRATPSDMPHRDQLLDPKNIPTQATVKAVEAWAIGVTGFTTTLQPHPVEGAKPLPGSGSEGTTDPLGITKIIFTDGNGDVGEYDAGALAWSLGQNTSMQTTTQLLVSLKDQGLK